MVHTLPPWTTKYRMATVFGQIDQGELAARLGSIVNYDRRGNVLWLEDFEQGLAKTTESINGLDAAVTISTDRALTGSGSCKLVAGSTLLVAAGVGINLAFSIKSTFGYEIAFSIDTNTDYILLEGAFMDGAKAYWWGIKYDHTNTNLDYRSDEFTYTTIDSSVALDASNTIFHRLKLVLDHTNNKYLRLLLNDTEYDLSAYPIDSSALVTTPRSEIDLTNYGRSENNDTVYVNHILVTQNEP